MVKSREILNSLKVFRGFIQLLKTHKDMFSDGLMSLPYYQSILYGNTESILYGNAVIFWLWSAITQPHSIYASSAPSKTAFDRKDRALLQTLIPQLERVRRNV